jgi:hypothetical protein
VRKAVCKKLTVFLKKSLFLFATCSMAHRSNYTFRTRARSQPKKKKGVKIWPLGIVCLIPYGAYRMNPYWVTYSRTFWTSPTSCPLR